MATIHSAVRPDTAALALDGSHGVLRTAPSHIVPLLGEKRLLLFPRAGKQLVCSEPEFRLLNALTEFRTQMEHVEALRREVPQLRDTPPAELVGIVSDFHNSGALVSVHDILQACSMPAPSVPPVAWLAIPTSNRNDELSRALRSYLTNAAQFGRQYRILIVGHADESSIVGGTSVCHVGPRSIRNYAAVVARHSGAPPDVLLTALAGFHDRSIAPGANRNMILLHTVGSLIVSADDDTVCNTARSSASDAAHLAVRGHEDPHRIVLFSDRRAALDSLRFEPRDWVADHERLLGRSPSSIVSAFAEHRVPDMDAMCPHIFDALMTGKGHVAMTLSGAAGDSGMHSSTPFLFNPGLGSPEGSNSQGVRGSREIVRATGEFSISHGFGSAQTMFAGFDNRDILPPFFPSYRNEDGIFATTVALCVKDAYFGHVPLVMQHLPVGPRDNDANAIGKLRVSDWVLAASSIWNPSPAMASRHRLKSLGWHMQGLGELPEREFLATLTPPLFAKLGAVLSRANQALASHNRQPGWWAREIDEYLEHYVNASLEPDYLTAHDIDATLVPNPMDYLRQMLRTYGLILEWWPEVVDAAKDLASRGIRPGVEIQRP